MKRATQASKGINQPEDLFNYYFGCCAITYIFTQHFKSDTDCFECLTRCYRSQRQTFRADAM